MRIALLLIFCISCLFNANAQNSAKEKSIKSKNLEHFELGQAQLTKSGFLHTHFTELGLSSPYELVEEKSIKGLAGWNRIKYKQEYLGLSVIGSKYTLHQKDGIIKRATGKILPNINVDINPDITSAAAERAAAKFYDRYLLEKADVKVPTRWNMSDMELVIIDRSYPHVSGNYLLAYKITLSDDGSFNQPIKEFIYVNAQNGNVITNVNQISHASVEGIVKTGFYGEQTVITDSIAPNDYVLRDSTRGGGIITLNASLQDFRDQDNYWDNSDDGKRHEYAGDCHYCASKYFDYMNDNFEWEGVDGEGMRLESRVYSIENLWLNASWNGTRATFGSGDCDQYLPLTTLTVVGHEFAHGFTGTTSELIYRNESGAINESISDCLGKALEYEYDFDNFTWFIGDKFLINPDEDQPFRNMEDPNTRNDPQYYGGVSWQFGDGASVHTNSGVMNYWFYLLVDGKADMNEVGYEYDVASIGMDKATQIVFSLNAGYLTEGSGYVDCMYKSLLVCDDLFGANSMEKAAVIEAWKAVGIDIRAAEDDINISLPDDLFHICNSTTEQIVEIDINNPGLNTVPAGTSLGLSYALGGVEMANETLVLTEDLVSGDTINFQFMQAVTLPPTPARNEITITIESDDFNKLNNTFEVIYQRALADGMDFDVLSAVLNKNPICDPEEIPRLRIIVRNTGCDTIPESVVPVRLVLEGQGDLDLELNLNFDMAPNAIASLSGDVVLERELYEYGESEVIIMSDLDANEENNSEELEISGLAHIFVNYLQTFDPQYSPFDDSFLFFDPDGWTILQNVTYDGEPMMGFSGEDSNPFAIEECTDPDVFFDENFQVVELEFCVDAIGLMEPTLAFDLVQFFADEIEETALPSEFGAMVRMTIDGEELPVIYGQTEGEIVHHEFLLPLDYQDLIRIEFLTLTGNDDAMIGKDFSEFDFMMLDNLELFDNVVSTTNIRDSKLKVFPNPGSGFFTFKNSVPDLTYDLTIFDSVGRTMATYKDQKGETAWDATSNENGIYFYTVEEENGTIKNGKIVLQK